MTELVSKSQAKRLAIQKGLDRPPKEPRRPMFPPNAEALAQKLGGIIDAGGEHAPLAYGALTRLCVMWVPPRPDVLTVVAQYSFTEGFDLSLNSQVIQDLIKIMEVLFPEGEGLPPKQGCPL